MNDPTLHDKIEAFLTGQMPPEDAAAFRRQMATDQRLASLVELQRLEHDAMNLLLEKDLKSKMAHWDEAPPPNPFGDGNGKTNYLKIGLPILLAGLLAIWGGYKLLAPGPAAQPSTEWPAQPEEKLPVEIPSENGPATKAPVATAPVEEQKAVPEKAEQQDKQAPRKKPATNGYLALSSSAYLPPPDLASNLKSGSNADEKTALQQAAEAFEKGDFAQAAQLLGPPAESDQSQVRFLRGHIYFKQQQFPAAQREFEAVAKARISQYKQDARWYLLLTYLAQLPARRAEFDLLATQLADEANHYSRMEEVKALIKNVDALDGKN